MRVGWLADTGSYIGGAERTQAEFRAAAPDNVEVVDCPPGGVVDCDRYAIHNCVTYTLADMEAIGDRPAFKYWNDIGSWVQADVRAWLDGHTQPICCSPLQADYMGLDAVSIPPPVDLTRFERANANANGRVGAVSVASWRNFGKAPHRVFEWAQRNGGIDFYGDGPFAPEGSTAVEYDRMPELLARYRVFVFLPTVIEPFGRLVVEAWAAGCEVVTNHLVGARWWIENQPDGLKDPAAAFWREVLA